MSVAESNSASGKKKVDSRIRSLIEGSVATGHRSFFVVVGDKGREQVVNLHYILSKAQVAKRPSVLWCFKKELELSSHRKKRMKQMKKLKQLGSITSESLEEDPFELFLTSTNIQYVYYHESERILGNTFGMCVLQDFEALTPNLLARTIETVQGGGIVILLLKTLTSLKQLCTMVMDVHSRYRTESSDDPVARFNERFLLSLKDCRSCLIVDDQLNVMPMSPFQASHVDASLEERDTRAKKLQDRIDNEPKASLVRCAKTVDQANTIGAIMAFLEKERVPRSTASVTAARGRGKSATMGLALAYAVSHGYANIFVTAPSEDNVKTLFEFLFKGLDTLGYVEHIDYDIVSSSDGTTAEKSKLSVARVNIYKNQHRQTILYVAPHDHHLLGQAELLIVDEAAAIPLPTVQKLLYGPHVAILSSTINGYEGTGRSLSLKLLASLKVGNALGRTLKEFKLEEPIRYAPGDAVELWLNRLLCLDASVTKTLSSCPRPEDCNLYLVNRDTLFSYHKASEAFLQRMMALYVSSHYKNTPNDLQLMSDAPGHLLFCLLPPVDESTAITLPDILAVVQVALEGRISRQSVLNSLSRGKKAAGDLIPWTLSQQFQDDDFASLSGARIVRIAVHPDFQGLGYGSQCLKLLEQFFKGTLMQPDAEEYVEAVKSDVSGDDLKPRINLQPLLLRAQQVDPRKRLQVHWLGSSFGLTPKLFKFWRQQGYLPTYLRQTANEITGEHTMIVLKTVNAQAQGVTCANPDWLSQFCRDFSRRFANLLSFACFKDITSMQALSIVSAIPILSSQRMPLLDPFDLKRLESYGENVSELGMVMDLIPSLAMSYFLHEFGPMSLSPVQQAIILALGLQRRDVDTISEELRLPASQVLSMLVKCAKKFAIVLSSHMLKELDSAPVAKAKNVIEASEDEYSSSIKVDEIQIQPQSLDGEDDSVLAPLIKKRSKQSHSRTSKKSKK